MKLSDCHSDPDENRGNESQGGGVISGQTHNRELITQNLVSSSTLDIGIQFPPVTPKTESASAYLSPGFVSEILACLSRRYC
jgi:hypothetical protein